MDKRYQGLSGELIAACMTKYQDFPDETWEQMVDRWVSVTDESFRSMFLDKAVIPGGSMMYGLGKPGNRKISLSNCVVQTIREDSIYGIMEAAARSARCYSYRMGVGTDLDILRPRDTLVNNAALTSSGAASFMQLFSTVCGTIGQQGRRGALMLTMSCWHPDIEEFITMKLKNDKVTNANITVKVTDDFMEAVINDKPWDLVWGGKVYKTIQATYLWNLIAETAFNSAEPGLLFIDRVWERPHANYEDSKPITTNPCGEIPLPDDDVCLLTSLYLPYFVDNPYTENAKFNVDRFKEHVRLAVRFGDKVKELDTEMVPYEAIAQKSRDFRRIGVGTHGLSDCFWRLNLTYGKLPSQVLTYDIYKTLMQTSYEESINLAEELGPFPKFDAEVEAKNKWLKERLPEELFERMLKVGRRNLHLNTIAPTGTTSYISHGCSSGIEPPFDIIYTRFCLGKIYEGVEHGEFTYYKQLTGEAELKEHMLVSHQLTPEERVKIQGLATNWLDNSCSSTINFLNGTTVQQVKDVYMKAFEEGCEGITVFVDGSREGIVTLPGVKRERPTELPGKVYQYGGADSNYYITVTYSESRGAIEEIFVGQLTDSNPMVDSLDARLYKLFKKYNLLNVVWKMEQDITPVNKVCYMMSMLFRHNVPTKEIISCTDGAIAGSLPFRIRMSILKTLPDSIAHAYDPDCLRGGCG